MQDERRAFQLEKEDLLDSVRELTRQLKLKTLVLENFVLGRDLEHKYYEVKRTEHLREILGPLF